MKNLYLTLAAALFTAGVSAQLSFSNATVLLNQTFNSGGCVAVSDMNQDGLDDIVHMNNSRRVMIEYQNPDGTFTLYDHGNISGSNQWGMCVGDVNNSGHNDVFSGGSYDGVHLLMVESPGVSNLLSLPFGNMFMQACNMADINNDGWLDAFACHDDAESRIWGNNGLGQLLAANEWIDATTTPTSDNSGNYGSVWTDINNDGHLDLYIAKCRQGVNNPADPRRINMLFVNDGNNNYTQQAALRGVASSYQSWTADFADVDNDGDMDLFITNHDFTLQLFENDGNGFFTDITAGSGLQVEGFFLQAILKDFDNDGYVDVLYAGGVHGFRKGNGDGTFTTVNNLFPYGDTMHSFAIGDLNNDGFLDVYASYGNGYINPDPSNPDVLWLNNGNANNYLALNLIGTESNRNAVGARVEIYGPWGVQIREVRSGESYGINNSFQVHFGLGQETTVDQVVIKWPSGIIETFDDVNANQALTVIENTCISQPATITADGPTVICAGTILTLTASAGESYLWSNGATTQSIEVGTAGPVSVTVFSGEGCFGNSPAINITFEPDETPVVSIDGLLEFCEGESVTLTSSAAAAYEWSNNATSQSIEVTESGTYSVTVEGTCQDFTSEMISVNVIPAPDAPLAEGDVIPAPGVATLTAVGNNLRWYDVPAGGTILSEGTVYAPFINATTPFYVEEAELTGGEIYFGGKEDNSGSGAFHNNSTYFQIFDAYEEMTIKSVKVYANGAGNRTIRVTGPNNTPILAEGTFNLPSGESVVDLNFTIPAGNNLEMKTTGNPQLYRNANNSGVSYPYLLGDMGAITSTNIQGANQYTYYYFFYNWQVERPVSGCVSERTEVLAVIDTTVGVSSLDKKDEVSVFPVPATDNLNVLFHFNGNYDLQVLDVTGKQVYTNGGVANEGQIHTINVKSLHAGLYFVKVISGDKAITRKVVVK
jgi:hypothetical protein